MMGDLQAAIEFQVELGKFYNVDLFQRGYYQVRVSLKSSPKIQSKVEVNLPRNSECDLVFPASIVHGTAVSKTFQILYRNEDVLINDIILFKVNMLVDSQRIEESIEKADFQLGVDLWFTEEDFGGKRNSSPDQHEKMECISQRNLKLNFTATQGIHHHVPVLYDYFHLCAVCVTIHGTLVALHQPYTSFLKGPKTAWTELSNQPTLETVLLGGTPVSVTGSVPPSETRLACARRMHKLICCILLSAYESLQSSLENLTKRLPPAQQLNLAHKDCTAKLDSVVERAKHYQLEEDLVQWATSDITQLCAENMILWTQYLEIVTFNDGITQQLARDHHVQRVKRFAEGFFTFEYPKNAVLDCHDHSVHGHADIVSVVRNSPYFLNLPTLPVFCAELDGDSNSLPLVFEDIYAEPAVVKKFITQQAQPVGNLIERSASIRSRSSAGSVNSDTSPRGRRHRKKFIKNIRPEAFRRPSYSIEEAQAHGQGRLEKLLEQKECTLVGYRKMPNDSLHVVGVELGTLSPATQNRPHHLLQTAASMPTLMSMQEARISLSASLPDLGSEAELKVAQDLKRISLAQRETSRDSGALCDSPSDPSKDDSVFKEEVCSDQKPAGDNVSQASAAKEAQYAQGTVNNRDSTSDVNRDSSTSDDDRNIQNGYLSSNGAHSSPSDIEPMKEVDYNMLAESLTKALGEPESLEIDRSDCTDSASERDRLPPLPGEKGSNGDYKGNGVDSNVRSSQLLSGAGSDSGYLSKCESDSIQTSAAQSADNVAEGAQDNDSSKECDSQKNMAAKPRTENEYMSEECTVLELLKMEYERSIKEQEENPQQSAEESKSSRSKSLVSPVSDATIQFITAKEKMKQQLNYAGHLYSDFPSQASTVPYFWTPDVAQSEEDEGIHLFICVHGLDGNSADLRLVRTYLEMALPGERIDFLMSERNQNDTFVDFDIMTNRLMKEILYHIDMYSYTPTRISFVGHSLGNLIIRSVLAHQDFAPFLPKLYTFLSLSGPHLGTLYNNSGLVNMGMWFVQKWKKSGSLLQLSMKDHIDPRQTFLYKLSQKPGMEFFKHILLVGSMQDRYVPYHSSRIELCRAAVRDTSSQGAAYCEMVSNIMQPIIFRSDITLIRYDIFHALTNTANNLIGRAAHIAVLDSELFIEKFLTVAGLKYLK